MQLAPIEQPRSVWLKLVYRMIAKQFGTVLGPVKVIYARKPRLLYLAAQIQYTMERGLSLDRSLRLLVQTHVARLNGCAFCADIVLASAIRAKIGAERFDALEDFHTSPVFSEKERAALAFAQEATLHKRISDATSAAVRAHFKEDEIVELTWLNAAENYFNLQAAVLGIESDGQAARLLEGGAASGFRAQT